MRLLAARRHVRIPAFPGCGGNQIARSMISVSIVDDEDGLRQPIAGFVNGVAGFKCVSASGTLRTHIRRIYEKLRVHARAAEVAKFPHG
jgi:hypothetical protein